MKQSRAVGYVDLAQTDARKMLRLLRNVRSPSQRTVQPAHPQISIPPRPVMRYYVFQHQERLGEPEPGNRAKRCHGAFSGQPLRCAEPVSEQNSLSQ
jgi:hypothetical protein